MKQETDVVERRITGFRQDAEGEWIAELECGHSQHVRHNPPWQVRPWVLTEAGRAGRIGTALRCRPCAESDRAPASDEAERLRGALVQRAQAAYEDALLQGLCAEGAWEAAVAAMRRLDLASVVFKGIRDPQPDSDTQRRTG